MKTTKKFILKKNHEFFAPRSLATFCLPALIFLLLAIWPSGVTAQTAVAPSGSGTASDPYQIATLENLYWISQNELIWGGGNFFIQTADIDASDTQTWSSGPGQNGFVPIGEFSPPFIGHYDGQGHTIDSLYINNTFDAVGLFGYVGQNDGDASIKNLGLTNVNITGDDWTGALAGRLRSQATVDNCYSTGSVTNNSDVTGGLVGVNVSNSTISNSYSTASVNGNNQTGGLVGSNSFNATVSNSYSTGSVNGTTNTGGLVGFIFDGGTVTNSYWNIGTSGQTTSAGGGTGLTTPEMRQAASFSGFDFINTWSIDEGQSYPYLQNNTQSPAPGSVIEDGSGTEADPYQVRSIADLDLVRNHLDKYFIQNVDIDASTTSGWDGGAGFTSIGNSTTAFTGQYDGDGHTISGLTINRGSEDNIGLFGYTDGAVIENIRATNVNITGQLNTGGLVGTASVSTMVSNSHTTGSVSGTTNVGGLIGNNGSSTVSNSHNDATLNGDTNVGGLVGFNNNSAVSASYNTGSVTGTGNRTGGLVGNNNISTVSNSYSTGDVNGTTNTGGLVGLNQNTSEVTTSYSTGNVIGTTNTGGLVGGNTATVTDSYWNTETSGQSTSAGGTGRTTAEMKQQASFSGFNFNGTWSIDEAVSYPYLQNNIPSPLPGLGDDPTVIYNKSLQFNGTDQYADLGSDPAAISGLSAITVELWVKPTAYENNDRLLEKEDEWYLFQGTDFIRWTIHGAPGSVTSGPLSTGQWVHVAGVYDGTTISLYINGDLKESMEYTGGIDDSPHPLTLAARRSAGGSPTNFFNGDIDEVRIWNTARNEEEIRRDMFQSLNGDETGLAGYWPLILVGGSTALDRTGNENDGMLTGDPTWSVASHPYGTVITGSEGWRMMTSPFGGASYDTLLDSLWTQGFTGADSPGFGDPNVFTWDETAGDWAAISDAADVPGAGTGFIVYVYEDDEYETGGIQGGFPKTILVENTQNDGTVAPTLTFTSAGVPEGDGWNLVGNPYGATIDWDATGWTKTKLNAPVYVWSDSAGGAGAYLTRSGGAGTLPGGLIAPFQGFWVQANGASPALTMTDDVRSAGGVFYKQAPVPQIRFRLAHHTPTGSGEGDLEGSELYSNAIVMLHEQAEAGKDPLDAWKLQSLNQDYLSLYTTATGGQALDINALPLEIEQPLELTMNFEGSKLGGKYTLSWNPKDLPEAWALGAVILTDLHTDRIIDLSQAGDYTFEVQPAKSKGSGVQPPPNHSNQSGLAQASTLEPPRHGPIPTVLKAKATNPRFMLTINPAGSGHRLAGIPEQLELNQNYPNPFNPATVIRYGVPEQARVTLNVYDILGRRVATLINEQRTPGRYQVSFNASRFASGLYIYRLRVGGSVLTKKMMLIK